METGSVVDAFFGLALAGILVEAVVTVVSSAKERYLDWRYWASIVIGVLVAVVYDVDLFAAAGLTGLVPFVGNVLTGVVVSRGANYAYDIMNRVRNPAGSESA